jgi:hypothetical protein
MDKTIMGPALILAIKPSRQLARTWADWKCGSKRITSREYFRYYAKTYKLSTTVRLAQRCNNLGNL